MMPDNQENGKLRTGAIKSFSWSYAEKIATQMVSFVLSIVLARLLVPEDYGKLALVNIFTGIMSAIALTGFGSALIQKKDTQDIDYSTALIFSFGVSVVAYLVLFFGAPLISIIMSADITAYMRVSAVSLMVSSVNTVLHARAIRALKFYKLFIASICGVAVSAAVGIYMAYSGFGVWALVAQHLSSTVVNTLVSALICGWMPKAEFSKQSVKKIYSFGWKLIASAVIDAVYRQLRSLAIGKKYTTTDLAYYDRGNQFPTLIVNNIDTSIASVLAPVLARKQDNLVDLKNMVRRGIKTSSVVLFPLLIGLAVCAEPIIVLMLTEKWLPCVPYLQILSIALMWKPIQTANLQGILAIGRSDIYLKIQIAQKILGVAIMLITILFFDSVLVVALGELIAYMLFACVNAYPNIKYLNYSIKEQLQDLVPQLLVSVLMGLLVYMVGMLQLNTLLLLVLQVFSGMVFYILTMRVLKTDAFMYLWNMLFSVLKKAMRKG